VFLSPSEQLAAADHPAVNYRLLVWRLYNRLSSMTIHIVTGTD